MKNIFKPNRFSIRLRSIAFLLLLVLSTSVLIFNSGLRNAYYHNTWVVELPDSATDEYLMGYSSSMYLSSLDRDAKHLRWQGIPQAEFEKVLTDIKADFEGQEVVNYQVREILPDNIAIRAVLTILVLLVVGLVYLYFVEIRNFLRRSVFWRVSGLNLMSSLAAVIIMLGVLSSISLLYTITTYSLFTIVLMSVWSGIGYFMSLRRISRIEDHVQALYTQRDAWQEFNAQTRWWWLLVMIMISIGLGTNFVADGIIMAMGLVLAGYAQQEFPLIIYRLWFRLLSVLNYRPRLRRRGKATKGTKAKNAEPKQIIKQESKLSKQTGSAKSKSKSAKQSSKRNSKKRN